jgi:hypothetical protein
MKFSNQFLPCCFFTLLFIFFEVKIQAQELYTMPNDAHTRWASPENPKAIKGSGAQENGGHKGHAFDTIKSHGHIDLLNVTGAGIINRIKLTVDNRTPEMLRSLRIEIYWDGLSKPAVSAPLGDFFGATMGKTVPFESELFANPEGRSFVCFVPMPFKKGARITIYNDSKKDLSHIFYNIGFEKWDKPKEDILYFHAYWHRNSPPIDSDFVILPEVTGNGKFLGAFIGVNANPVYKKLWWGEGEIKVFLDGDNKFPTLAGTGVEDYIGTAWGTGKFINMTEGCLIADTSKKQWAFYRYHISDPVFFHKNIKITVQQIGGGPRDEVRKIKQKGAPMDIISVDLPGNFIKLKEMKNPPDLMDEDFPKGWTNFYRSDDWCATAFFYLDKPGNNLPSIVSVDERVENLN